MEEQKPSIDTNPIELTPVESSRLQAIGYNPDTQTLAIQFSPASVYHYANFTAEDWAAFQAAESKGSHFIKNIQNAKDKYPYVKIPLTVEEPQAA